MALLRGIIGNMHQSLTVKLLSIFCISSSLLSAVEIGEIVESRQYITETDFTGNNNLSANIFVASGMKFLQDSDWAPANRLDQYGILADIGLKRWPIRFAVDVFSSSATESNATATFTSEINEVHVGARFVMDIPDSHFTLHSGAGMVFANMEITGSTGPIQIQNDVSTFGGYYNFGFYAKLRNRWLLGFDLRYTDIRGNLGDAKNANGGGWNTLLLVGLRF